VIRPSRSPLVPLLALVAGGVSPTAAQQVVELPRRDRELTARFETVATIGKFDGADWETFGEVSDLDFDAAGNLYIFDAQKQRVVVVGPTGRLVRTFGKPGDGPGELRAPAALVVNRDGSVAIADMGHRAFVVYGPDGEYARSVPFGGDAGMVILGRLFPDGRGGVLSAGQQMMMMQRDARSGRPAGPMAPPRGHPIVRFSLEGQGGQRQLLRAWQPERPEGGEMRVGGMPGGRTMAFRGPEDVAFEPRLLSGILPDGGLAFSDSSAYAIKLMGPDGAVRRVLTRPLEPRRVTRAIQDAERERRLAELEAGGGPQIRVMVGGPVGGGGGGGGGGGPQPMSQDQIKQMRRQQIEQMQFYPELPVLFDLATGWSGKIWAVRRGRGASEPGPIDLISPAGDYLGTLPAGTVGLPRAFGPNGLAAWIERDDLDVPRVVVRRLPADLR
jgi:hypothetical protein